VSFTHVLGHDRVVARLAGAAAREAPHHAYIFHGPDGVGRRQVAVGFAAALNCERVDASGGACGQCGSCTRIQSGTDADVWIVEPTPPEGRKSGSLAIRINHVRELQGRLAYRVSDGLFRVVVIDDCELMTHEAANCLLKSLEEPPARTVLILVTRRLGQMLPTIRSRCLQIGFRRLDSDLVERYLVEHTDAGPDEARQLAAAAAGSIGRALDLTVDDAVAEIEMLRRFFTSLSGGPGQRLEMAADIHVLDTEARKTQTPFLRRFVVAAGEVLRDATSVAAGEGSKPRRPDCADLAKGLASRYDADALLRMFDALQTARDRLDRNIATRLVMEALLLEID
jgi:DNA polymerase III subunit delta'